MAKQKTKYQKGKAGIPYVVMTVLLIVASVVAACTVFFRVEFVTVEGNARYSEEQILAVANVEFGANLILTPEEQIAHRVSKNLPYVEQVKAQKRFPTTLKLIVKESQPVSVMSDGEKMWIVDGKGRLLEAADESLALQYISIKGLQIVEPEQGEQVKTNEETAQQLHGLLSLTQALQSHNMAQHITSIDASSKTEITMMYEDRLVVKMLNNADFERKTLILQEIVALLGEQERGTVNLKTETAFFSPG